MTEYKRVREEIENMMINEYSTDIVPDFEDWTIRILSLKGIEIRADDQSTPYSEYVDGIFQSRDQKLVIKSFEKNAIYEKAQQDMLKAGFIKVIPEEEYGS